MRRTGLVSTILCLALGGSLAAPVSQPTKDRYLDGTHWTIKVVPDEEGRGKGEKAYDDTIRFEGGTVAMTECLKYGFGESDYTLAKNGDAWSFSTRQSSDKEGTTLWKGKIKGSKIGGTLIWTKRAGSVVRYTFEGQKSEP